MPKPMDLDQGVEANAIIQTALIMLGTPDSQAEICASRLIKALREQNFVIAVGEDND